MARSKKKRNKPYRGEDAIQGPVVHHYTAEVRSPLAEWWLEHKRVTKIVAGTAGSIMFVSWLLVEASRIIF